MLTKALDWFLNPDGATHLPEKPLPIRPTLVEATRPILSDRSGQRVVLEKKEPRLPREPAPPWKRLHAWHERTTEIEMAFAEIGDGMRIWTYEQIRAEVEKLTGAACGNISIARYRKQKGWSKGHPLHRKRKTP